LDKFETVFFAVLDVISMDGHEREHEWLDYGLNEFYLIDDEGSDEGAFDAAFSRMDICGYERIRFSWQDYG